MTVGTQDEMVKTETTGAEATGALVATETTDTGVEATPEFLETELAGMEALA